ncbi:MAG: HPr kinase/phosphatase C-terminal domain-containing protein [Methylocystis sp.]
MNAPEDGAQPEHANALLLGETGVLLRGVSGAGKSTLTSALIARAAMRGMFARLIGDDRVMLVNCNGRLIARPHPLAAGRMELRGLGLVSMPFEPAGVIRRVVDLAPPGEASPRYPFQCDAMTQLRGLSLPRCFAELRDPAAVEKIFLFCMDLQ